MCMCMCVCVIRQNRKRRSGNGETGPPPPWTVLISFVARIAKLDMEVTSDAQCSNTHTHKLATSYCVQWMSTDAVESSKCKWGACSCTFSETHLLWSSVTQSPLHYWLTAWMKWPHHWYPHHHAIADATEYKLSSCHLLQRHCWNCPFVLIGQRELSHLGPVTWNQLRFSVRHSSTAVQFNRKTHLFPKTYI